MNRPTVKICGLTRPEDVALCQTLGVDFIGFILAEESPRRISPSAIAAMATDGPGRVGVFTTADAAAITAAMEEASLDYAQLHGGQDEAVCRAVGPERIIKVFWPERQDGAALQAELNHFAQLAAYFLFDAGSGGGGAGRAFAWECLRELAIPRPWFLAGGISPATASRAITACFPFGLDVSSGVELEPGVKDHGAIRELVRVATGETIHKEQL